MLGKIGKLSVGSSSSAHHSPALSVIGPDVRIVGDIFTKGEMQIDGQVEGDITCQNLVVGEGAVITGAVEAQIVRIHGRLNGRISAESVTLAKTAEVAGDITHGSLQIDAGALIEGHILRKDHVKAVELPAPTPVAAPAPPQKPRYEPKQPIPVEGQTDDKAAE